MAVLDVKRRLVGEDLDEVNDLLTAVERADGQRPLSDHMWIDLRQGGRSGFAALIAREPGHDHLVAYGQLSRGNDSWLIDLVVHPHHRYEMDEIGPRLMGEAMRVVADEGGGHVHWWVFEPTDAHARLAARLGLRVGRTTLQMRVALPLPDEVRAETAPITTRPFRTGVDEDAWLAVNNRAFAEHPEQGGWTPAVLSSREREPWFDPAGFLLHESDDGALDGFCWTKLHADASPTLGEIYVIAVDPDAAGRGLGRSLVVAGLEHLADSGAPVGMLYVDADNERALRLYHAIGFRQHHVQRAFVGDVAGVAH